MKKTSYVSLLFLFLFAIILTVQSGRANASPNNTAINLKIGMFYILYTKPAAPYVDENQRLLVPARTLEDLMGGHVAYDAKSKTATVTWLDHVYKLTIGSLRAHADGTEVRMDTSPVLRDGAMFLPIRLFLDHSNVQYSYLTNQHLLHVTDTRVVVGEAFEQFRDNDYPVANKDGELALTNFRYIKTKEGRLGIQFEGRNLTDRDIPEGNADIMPFVKEKDGSFAMDSYTRPINKPVPLIGAEKSFTVTRLIGTTDAAYIFTVARTAE
ncbi:stalk domain-containing protein [Paenibacillus humicola]|uniref:stalk domain-containing protein n=1 Tax=Paenibacillus humicola TaxID=3110540 RepID=UPI00237A571E|nr:stalk domain-containing protein [Paenibacillus humicola]